jgi:hypothetical protein
MARVVEHPALFFDQVGDPSRCPQATLVSQSLRPSLQATFDAPHVFPTQACFASGSSRPTQRPQPAFLQLLRPTTYGLSMSTHTAGHFCLVYPLAQ